MGRPASINEADITKAVETLQESGRPVNPYRIRQVLGKGSTAKIAHYLQGLDIESTYEDSEFQAAIDVNAERSEYLTKLVRPLIFQLEEEQQSAIAEAQAKFEAQRQELEDLARGLEEKLSVKQSEVELLETRLANVERQRDSLEDDNQQLKIAAAANHEKQKALQEKIHSQSEEITERKNNLNRLVPKKRHSNTAIVSSNLAYSGSLTNSRRNRAATETWLKIGFLSTEPRYRDFRSKLINSVKMPAWKRLSVSV